MFLSTGERSTLGAYRRLAVSVFGEDSAATKFIDKKIEESPSGEYEPVVLPEGQVLFILASLSLQD